MMSRTLSNQMYWLFYVLCDKFSPDDLTQERSNIVLNNRKNYAVFWRFRQHMRMDPIKIRIEDRIVWFKLIDTKRSYRKLFYDKESIIPYEDPLTDSEIEEPCCRDCHRKREFFVCWVLFPFTKIEIFCKHSLADNILDIILF